jgi:hypothetical protein
MRFSWSRIGATAVLGLFVATGAGCTLVNKIRAKNELNETARAYKAGRFEEAEQHAKRALYLDPNNPTAPIFIPSNPPTVQARRRFAGQHPTRARCG